MNEYNKIKSKYIEANIQEYRFKDALDVEKVLGYDFRTMRGFKELEEDKKQLAEKLICSFINGHGLETREGIRPTKISREPGKFKVTFKNNGFSYLYDNGTVV
ncbi:hypothetical protein [Parabacteroides distasonis]|uniref:hypothetical protein n=1 Tax=Parabacteroides distasonis TaxID=823 RepID=UPI0012B1667B|nr:hypothetical protein [Parabacteroides distasonis]MRY42969.1 hypothetical protein [Parabacteroides distasonis]